MGSEMCIRDRYICFKVDGNVDADSGWYCWMAGSFQWNGGRIVLEVGGRHTYTELGLPVCWTWSLLK